MVPKHVALNCPEKWEADVTLLHQTVQYYAI